MKNWKNVWENGGSYRKLCECFCGDHFDNLELCMWCTDEYPGSKQNDFPNAEMTIFVKFHNVRVLRRM